MKIYEQTAGNDKGHKVEFVKEKDGVVTLKTISSKFKYTIKKESFELYYKLVEEVLDKDGACRQ